MNGWMEKSNTDGETHRTKIGWLNELTKTYDFFDVLY